MISKKNSLEHKEYYNYSTNILSQKLNFEIPETKASFQNIVQTLVLKKYISVTKDGFYNLLPNGVFLRNAVLSLIDSEMQNNNYLEYRFTSFFSLDKDDPKQKLVDRFTDDIYKVDGDNKYFLKYASDPVIFDYFKNRKLNSEIKIYTPDYYYRVSTDGELKHLINPREFLMTDFHIFSHNKFDDYVKAAIMNKNILEKFVNINDVYLNIDTNKKFYESNKKEIVKMFKSLELNAVINITSEKTHYYSIQNQYITNYYKGNKTQFANLQYDEVNGERFNIRSGTNNNFLNVVHGTPIGRIEKILAYIFGKAIELSEANKSRPVIPTWISPIVCTFVPINGDKKISDYCDQLSKKLSKHQIRNNVDLRNIQFRKKIEEAEKQWIPYIVMIGDREYKNKNISVRTRHKESIKINSLDDLILYIENSTKRYPNLPQNTKRIILETIEY